MSSNYQNAHEYIKYISEDKSNKLVRILFLVSVFS